VSDNGEKHAVEKIFQQMNLPCATEKKPDDPASDREKLLAGEVTAAEDRCKIIYGPTHKLLTAEDYVKLYGDSDMLVRMLAAYFASVMLIDKAPAQTLDVLGECLGHLDELKDRFDALPFGGPGYFHVYIARGLNNVTKKDDEVSRRALPLLLKALRKVHFSAMGIYMKAVFGLAFGDCEPPFTDGYLRLLDMLIDEGVVDWIESDDDQLAEAFSMFGLPTDEEELESLVERIRKSEKPAEELSAVMHGES
jgi:hypothetical protein